ncbi:response regulator transcription factor [Chloroflexota bacterium]
MKVLIIEDDNEIIDIVAKTLELKWPDVSLVSTNFGGMGVQFAEKESPDIIILDLGLPDMGGFEVLRKIRGFSKVPVIILTVRADEINKIRGLEMGADDYIVKPFSPGEFVARLKTALRRSQMPETTTDVMEKPFIRGNLRIDFRRWEVSIGDKLIKLSPSEYDLLYMLVNNEGQVMSKKMLIEKVWGPEYVDDTEYVEVYINSLKEILAKGSGHALRILDEGNMGYKLVSQ